MEEILYWGTYCVTMLFELYIYSKLMPILLGERRVGKLQIGMAYAAKFIACTVQYIVAPYPLINSIMGILTIFLIAYCYGNRIDKQLIATIIVGISLIGAEVIVAGIMGIAGIGILEYGYNGNAVILIEIQIIFLIIYRLIRRFKNIKNDAVLPKIFDFMVIVISIITYAIVNVIFMQDSINITQRVIAIICMFIVIFFVIYVLDFLVKYYVEEQDRKNIKKEKEYYYEQAKMANQKNEEMREFRHNINNMLCTIDGMLENDKQEVKKYVEKLLKKVNDDNNSYSDTGNVAFDSIVNYKLSEASGKGIDINSRLNIPMGLEIQEEDIVVIIGNLLDNAMEALESVSEDRYISLNVEYKAKMLVINVKNKYDGKIHTKNGRIETKKENKYLHGIGLKSIESTVKKYAGYMNIDYTDTEFKVNIVMFLN